MKIQETLHGGTAAFIAAIASALSRNISKERMHELASRPDDMKRLLLPLVDDEWINMCPLLLNNRGNHDGLVYLSGINDIHSEPCLDGESYNIQDVIKSAYRHHLRFLNEGRAQYLAQLVFNDDEAASTKRMTGRVHDIYFPFARDTHIFAWTVLQANESVPDLIKINPRTLFNHIPSHQVWYFHPGHQCHMEKYLI